MKLFNLVQYLMSVDFYHDTFDLEEEGIEKILRQYGICEEFSTEEIEELRRELNELAEQVEFGEAVRLAHLEDWQVAEVV